MSETSGIVLYDPKSTAVSAPNSDGGESSWITRLVETYGPIAVDVAMEVLPIGRFARLGVSLGKRWLARKIQKATKPIDKKDLLKILPVDASGEPYVPEDQTAEVRKYLESIGLGGYADVAHAQHIAAIEGAARMLSDLGSELPVIDRRGNVRARSPEEVVAFLAKLRVAAAPEMLSAYAEVLAYNRGNASGRRF